jgi:hypothetical protein
MRLCTQLTKDAEYNMTHEGGSIMNTKLIFLYRRDLTNVEAKIDAYRFNMEKWWKQGKRSHFRNDIDGPWYVASDTEAPAATTPVMERKVTSNSCYCP